MLTKTRKRLAAWIEPKPDPIQYALSLATARAEPVEQAWPALAAQFALRVLATSYQASEHLSDAEDGEHDPDRLDRLYRADHAITRIRRQAENLQVLSGIRVEDAGSQVTTLLDVARAATSAIEHFTQVRFGRIVDLAVVEFASDDVMRVLTELLDNATRFSPPSAPVTVSAHLTDGGHVLVRVEDAGVGLTVEQLATLNQRLDGGVVAGAVTEETRVGLVIAHRLCAAHGLRVRLTPRQSGGVTATLLIPGELLCEIPIDGDDEVAPPPPHLRSVPTSPTERHANATTGAAGTTSSQAGMGPDDGFGPLPRRTPGSTREAIVGSAPGIPPTRSDTAWPDDAVDFAAGFADAHRALAGEPVEGDYIKGTVQ